MNVEETTISGVYRIHPRVHVDGRGEFWRAFCREQLGLLGIGFDQVTRSRTSAPYPDDSRGPPSLPEAVWPAERERGLLERR